MIQQRLLTRRAVVPALAVLAVLAAVLLMWSPLFEGDDTALGAPDAHGNRAGHAWDGKGTGSMSQSDLEALDAYSAFWLGPSFAGFNLQAIGRVQYNDHDEIGLMYGRCTISRNATGCPVPVGVHIQPICAIPPELTTLVSQPHQIRPSGVRVAYFEAGHAMLWTGDVVITIHTSAAPERLDEAIAALTPLGKTAERGVSAEMPPDSSRCAPS